MRDINFKEIGRWLSNCFGHWWISVILFIVGLALSSALGALFLIGAATSIVITLETLNTNSVSSHFVRWWIARPDFFKAKL